MTTHERRIVDLLIMKLRFSNLAEENRLRRKYPNLSAYDMQLCTYLRANLSTKEIATMLNITPDSVKKAKHRLRKKLMLNPEQPFSIKLC